MLKVGKQPLRDAKQGKLLFCCLLCWLGKEEESPEFRAVRRDYTPGSSFICGGGLRRGLSEKPLTLSVYWI